MNIEARILETLTKMPISLQEELLHYAEYLQEKYNQKKATNYDATDVKSDFRTAWYEGMTGQTIPVSQLWEDLENE